MEYLRKTMADIEEVFALREHTQFEKEEIQILI
jgi:hypothetical protein